MRGRIAVGEGLPTAFRYIIAFFNRRRLNIGEMLGGIIFALTQLLFILSTVDHFALNNNLFALICLLLI